MHIEEIIKSYFGEQVLEIFREYVDGYLDLSTAKTVEPTYFNKKTLEIKILDYNNKTHKIFFTNRSSVMTDQEIGSHRRCTISMDNTEQVIYITGYREQSGKIIYEPARYKDLVMFYDQKKCKVAFNKRIDRKHKENDYLIPYTGSITTNEKYGIEPTAVIKTTSEEPIYDMIKYIKENVMCLQQNSSISRPRRR